MERSWWAGFNGIYLVRFGFRMWEILILKVISAMENSNKFQKLRFWKEKSLENVVTLLGILTIEFKHDFLSYLAIQKIWYIHCKAMFTCFLSYLAIQKIDTCIAKQCSHVSFHIWLFKKFIHTLQNNVHMFPFIFGYSKNWYIHCKTMFICWVSHVSSHLGQQHMPH
jgi:hypothetical protein